MGLSESGRQRKRRQRMDTRQAEGLAFRVQPQGEDPTGGAVYRGDRLDQHAPGEHVWITTAVFLTTEASIKAMMHSREDAPILMDREALALVTGPGCWVCEQQYTPAVAARPCPGDPGGQ